MTDEKPFSERLLWARSEAGLTQKDLASKSGISLPQIVRYEAGRSTPRLGGALKLARVLNMDAYDLLPELKKTTRETEIDFSDEEEEVLRKTANGLGISIEELIRKIVMKGLRERANDPEFRELIDEDLPGLVDAINDHDDEADDDLA